MRVMLVVVAAAVAALLLATSHSLSTNASPTGRLRRFVVPRHKWPNGELSWQLHDDNLEETDMFVARNSLHRAFALWEAAVAPTTLQFTEMAGQRRREADMNIRFLVGEHGDDMPFDGPEGVIGHAFYPPVGELHLDAEEDWTLDGRGGTDLFQTLVHEIGHLLGLETPVTRGL